MKAVLVPRAAHHQEWCGPFAEGLRKHGWTAEIRTEYAPCDLLVLWGVRNVGALAAQKRAGGEVCILERGYLGDRFHWTSVSFGGGLNGRGKFRTNADPMRFARHFTMQPWKARDGYALIIGQVPGDMSLAPVHGDLGRWYAQTTKELREAGYDVRFRNHPQALKRGMHCAIAGASEIGGGLSDALSGAAIVVTFNSNTAVESVLAGVPTMAADVGSMAWPVTSHSVAEGQVMPDRSEWAARLAWSQWSMAEIASGECWDAVKG